MKFIFREMRTGMVIRCFAIKVKGAIQGEGASGRFYITMKNAGNTACVFMMICLAILCLYLIQLTL